ncbi:MAG: M48 family metalloprotease, partial [Hasllibacter sp.]
MRLIAILAALALAACAPATVQRAPPAKSAPAAAPALPGGLPPREAARAFAEVVDRVEPVAEALCRAQGEVPNCDYRVVVDDRPGAPPNAFQTRDARGRPIVGLTLALIAGARNADELAFILGHEMAHHIAGHLDRAALGAAEGQ